MTLDPMVAAESSIKSEIVAAFVRNANALLIRTGLKLYPVSNVTLPIRRETGGLCIQIDR